jgi:electron transfer flavoprotein alpha subunit
MIFVFAEHNGETLTQAAKEALAAARHLGDDVTALVFGEGVDAVVQAAFHHGADRVMHADDATLATFRLEPYADLLTAQAREHTPAVIVAAASTRGRELLAAVSADLDAPLLDDVTDVSLEGDKLHATRPIFAGKVLSQVVAEGAIKLVTLRNRAFAALEPDDSRSGYVLTVEPLRAEDDVATKIESVEARSDEISLTEAAIIVSGGRGVGGPEGFAPIKALADTLGGAMGASRATVDAGWIPYEHQVGQTGKVVSPDVYIAAGISGAIQHQAGMRTSKTIIAINKDPDAPIFKLARYGVVGDLFEIVPALTDVFKEKLSK